MPPTPLIKNAPFLKVTYIWTLCTPKNVTNCIPNLGCELLMAFHKRNSFCTLDPFFKYWKLIAITIPLCSLDLDDEDDIGGTGLPGPNTGSIQLYRISYTGGT